MKHGLLINKHCLNLGDDIQSYAESLFLPRIDYLVDREYISHFKPEFPGELVATIMGAWWTRHKWNFLPPRNIYPLWTSVHLTNYTPEGTGTMPDFKDVLVGVAAENLKAYGPVGTRDIATLSLLRELDIPAYFSGCVTLTLPKQIETRDNNQYLLIVDLDPAVETKLRSLLKGSDLTIRKISNKRNKRRTETEASNWDFRRNETIELLSLYQNARCVVTRRLHVALPCLAMGVPVLCVHYPTNSRFDPYNKWLNMVSPKDFLNERFEFNFIEPKQNSDLHLPFRQKLTEQLNNFVKFTSSSDSSAENLIKIKYSDSDVIKYKYKLMEKALNKWQPASIKMAKKLKKYEKNIDTGSEYIQEIERLRKQLKDIKNTRSWKITKPLRQLYRIWSLE